MSHRVLAGRMSIAMEPACCVEALQEAIGCHGQPVIFNTDQGVQVTDAGFLDEMESRGIRVGMDGKGRFLDTISIERAYAPTIGRNPKEDFQILREGTFSRCGETGAMP